MLRPSSAKVGAYDAGAQEGEERTQVEQQPRPEGVSPSYGRLAQSVSYSVLPPGPLLRFARLKALLQFRLSSRRIAVERDLKALSETPLPQDTLDLLVRRRLVYKQTKKVLFRLPLRRGFTAPADWRLEGAHHLDNALAQGRGVIALGSHFGYGQLAKYVLRREGYRLQAVGAAVAARDEPKTPSGTAFPEFVDRHLRRHLNRHLRPGERDIAAGLNLRPIFRALKRNEIVLLVADGLKSTQFVEVEFLGQTVPFASGFVDLWRASGATVVPLFCVDSQTGDGLTVQVEDPLVLNDEDEDPIANVRRYVRVFEAYVRRYPHLLPNVLENWVRRRWAASRGIPDSF